MYIYYTYLYIVQKSYITETFYNLNLVIKE